MPKQKAAGIIIYRHTDQGILFLLMYHGGRYWNFPKGKIEEGKEKPWETALREIKEETGLNKKDLRFHHSFEEEDKFTFKQRGKQVTKNVTFFLAESRKRNITVKTHEHRGYVWMTLKEANQIISHKNTKQLLKKAYDTLRRKSSRNNKRDSQR